MGRIHLFEFECLEWFPTFLRNYGTDFLQFLSNKTNMYKPVVPIIERGLKQSGTNQIIDLSSGGGGGLIWLNSELIKTIPDLKIVLTDYYPKMPAFKLTKQNSENFDFIDQPIDARNVPNDLKGFERIK